MKVHIALDTDKFDQSVAFYRAFLGNEPVKHKPGYAKFELESPGLNLTLNQSTLEARGGINHLGLQVESTEQVKEAAQRLEKAGLITWEETDTNCCYALQDKVWIQDPNGYRWEVFVVKVADTQPEAEVAIGEGEKAVATGCC